MKKSLLRTFAAILLLFATAATTTAEIISEPFFPGDSIATIKWTLDTETGIMTISGKGYVPNYSSSEQCPWKEHLSNIKKIVAEEGVYSLGNHSFAGCTALTEIHIPKSLQQISGNAFYNCPALKNIHIKDIDSYSKVYIHITNVDDINSGLCNIISLEKDPETGIKDFKFGEPRDLILNGEKVTKVVLENSYNPYNHIFAGTSIENVEFNCSSIGDYTFLGCSKLKNADLSKIKNIGYGAFMHCSSLTDLKIGAECNFNLYYLAPTFHGCTSLKNIILEEGVERLDNIFGSQYDRNGKPFELETLTIPGSLQEIIPNVTFKKAYYKSEKDWYESKIGNIEKNNIYINNKLWQPPTDVTVPEGTTAIRYGKFSKNTTSISIPGSVTEIDTMAFAGTIWYNNRPDGLVYNENWLVGYKGETPLAGDVEVKEGTQYYVNIFTLNNNITSIKLPEGIKKINDESFYNCYSLTSINIPNSVTNIGNYAFQNCNSLTSINIGNGDKYIGKGAFSGCTNLKEITLGGKCEVENGFFIDCKNIEKITILNSNPLANIQIAANISWETKQKAFLYVPAGSKEAYIANEYWGLFNIINEIGSNIIDGTLPNGVKWEVNLTTNTLTLSGKGTVSDETPWNIFFKDIDNIVIGDNVDILNKKGFEDTNWYNNQPEGLLYIGNSFMGYKNVTDTTVTVINIKEGTGVIADEALKNNKNIEKVYAPSSLKYIGKLAFSGCSALTSIEMENVETIGASAFSGCTALVLERLNLKKLTSLGTNAFANCHKLERIISLGEISEIPSNTFQGCKVLESINIPTSVRTIGENALRQCSSLKKITIPNSVNSIADHAFRKNSALDTVIIASHNVFIGRGAFMDCDSIKAVYILSDSVPTYYMPTVTTNRPFMTGNIRKGPEPRGTLYVPLGCKDKYPENITKDFTEVAEMDMTALRNATGIDTPIKNSNYDGTVYDLRGNKVENPEKGIYIINGKKILIK